MSEPLVYQEKFHLVQEALAALIVHLDPPSSGIVIFGKMGDGTVGKIKVTGSSMVAVALPFSALEIRVGRLPDLKGYRIQQVQRAIDLSPIR